jgi:hypothetical protein
MSNEFIKANSLALIIAFGAASDLTSPSASDNKSHIRGKHELALSDGARPVHVPEESCERLLEPSTAAIHSGVESLFIQPKNKNYERDFSALEVSCGENALALSALHFAI